MLTALKRLVRQDTTHPGLNGLKPLSLVAAGISALPAVSSQLTRFAGPWLPGSARRLGPPAALAAAPAALLVLVGGGFMYLFDPVSGAHRRGMMRERLVDLWERVRHGEAGAARTPRSAAVRDARETTAEPIK
jgi:hypothetical protein